MTKTPPRPLSPHDLRKVVGGVRIGGEGDDYLTTRDPFASDGLFGGGGNDTLEGGFGSDLLDGGDGDDILFGSKGDDDLRGGSGDDRLDGGSGSDFLNGGAGDDIFVVRPGEGSDTLQGGPGRDTVRVDAPADAYRIVFTSGGIDPRGDGGQLLPGSQGTLHFNAGGSVAFSGIESITHR